MAEMSEAARKAKNDYYKAWRKDHPDNVKEANRRYRENHPDRVRESNCKYWEKRAEMAQKAAK